MSVSSITELDTGFLHDIRAAATRDDSRSTGSPAFGSPALGAFPCISDRWPPADPPLIPNRSGETPYFFAFARTNRTARCMSVSTSGMVYFGWLPCMTANTT